jgi:[pyruvate, water dikinase]-phosphate phosphotransferase / [pyruvate, water dikinase] kinase
MTTLTATVRSVFFVSDHSGVTAETLGHSLLSQFERRPEHSVTLPFVASPEKAEEARRLIDAAALRDGARPIVFSTLVREVERAIVKQANGLFLDFFDAFLLPLEQELGQTGSHMLGRSHGMGDAASYMTRIEATNFALANDDGGQTRDYHRADVILVGLSRSGKTPTCLYLALQYGVYAANYPLTEEDLGGDDLPAAIRAYRAKLFGLTIAVERLREIRQVRKPDSRYSSRDQIRFEVEAVEGMYRQYGIPSLDTTHSSVEEIASRLLQITGVQRRIMP